MICPFCHREIETEHSEGHHVAGSANAPRFKIQTCADCHNGPYGLTDRQRDAGVHLSHEEPGDEHDRTWAFVHGVGELVVAFASSDDADARTVERLTLLSGRVIAADADHPIGPDPIAASAREAKRKRNHPGRAEPTIESHTASFAARFQAVARAWRDELGRPLGLSLDERSFASLLLRLDGTEGAAMIQRDLTGILGRIDEFATDPLGVLGELDGLEQGARTIFDLLGRVATVENEEEAAAILGAVS